MLEIIGWMLCLSLFVKGWEIAGNQSNYVKTSKQLAMEENLARAGRGNVPRLPGTRLSASALMAMFCAWSGAAVFPVVIHSQPKQAAPTEQPRQSFSDCLRDAGSVAEIKKCQAH